MTTDTKSRVSLIELDLPTEIIRTEPAPVIAAVAPTVRQAIPVIAPVGGRCACPIGTRPAAVRGGSGVNVCPACSFPRGAVPVAAPVQASAESAAVARDLGVNAIGSAPVRSEIVTPREQVLREIAGKASTNRAATPADLRKWEVLLRSTTEPVSVRPAGHVSAREVVAGARHDAAGIFTGFGGLGQLTRAEVLQVLAETSTPAEWAPAAKSAHAQAGRVVGALASVGYVVRATRVPKLAPGQTAETPRDWRARWTVGSAIGASNVGDRFGITILTVTLTSGNELRIEGNEGLAAKVRGEFEAAIAGEIYAAADVTAWIQSVIVQRFRGARIGGNWYVQRRYAAACELLLTAISKRWGREWLLPAIPMSTTEQLCAGLVANFSRECEAVLAEYTEALDEAKAHGKNEIGTRRATSLLADLRTLAERAAGYASMLGDRHVGELRTKLRMAGEQIAQSIDGASIRYSLLDFCELKPTDGNASGPGR